MKTVFSIGVAAAALFLCSSAFAADLGPPPVEAAPVPVAYDWTGFYAGVHGGVLWGNDSVRDTDGGVTPGPFDFSVNGGFGGVQAGYNWEAGAFVLGAEGDLGFMAPNGSGVIGSAAAAAHQDLTLGSGAYGDITGRAGFAVDRALIYAKGGAAFFSGEAKQQTTNPGYVATGTDTFFGWTAGAGIEYALTDNLTAKLEYQHFDFGVQKGFQTNVSDLSSPIGFVFDNQHTLGIDTVKVGLNYKF